KESLPLNPVRATQLEGNRFARPLFRGEGFRLEGRWLARKHLAQVAMKIAGVQLPAALDITRRSHAKAEVGFVGPVNLVVPAAPARTRKAGNFIMLEAGLAERIDGVFVQGEFGLFIEGADLALLLLFPEARAFLEGQAIGGKVIGLQGKGPPQVPGP